MAILDGVLPDLVTYWTRTSLNDYGMPGYSSPVTISGRWNNTQTLLRDANGEEIVSNVVIYCSVNINIGDWIYLGTSVDDNPPDSAYEIKQKFVRRDLSGNETIYRYYL